MPWLQLCSRAQTGQQSCPSESHKLRQWGVAEAEGVEPPRPGDLKCHLPENITGAPPLFFLSLSPCQKVWIKVAMTKNHKPSISEDPPNTPSASECGRPLSSFSLLHSQGLWNYWELKSHLRLQHLFISCCVCLTAAPSPRTPESVAYIY